MFKDLGLKRSCSDVASRYGESCTSCRDDCLRDIMDKTRLGDDTAVLRGKVYVILILLNDGNTSSWKRAIEAGRF